MSHPEVVVFDVNETLLDLSGLVACRPNTDGVSPALDSPDCVEVLTAAPRLRLRASPCQMNSMTRSYARPI